MAGGPCLYSRRRETEFKLEIEEGNSEDESSRLVQSGVIEIFSEFSNLSFLRDCEDPFS